MENDDSGVVRVDLCTALYVLVRAQDEQAEHISCFIPAWSVLFRMFGLLRTYNALNASIALIRLWETSTMGSG
jgi:hypothetical protein